MQNFYSSFKLRFWSRLHVSCYTNFDVTHMIWLNPTSAPSGPVLKQTSVPSFFPSLQASDCLRGVLCVRDIQRISKKWQSLPQDQATAVHHFHPPTMQSKPQSGHFKVFANNSSGIYQHLRLTEMICFTLSLYTYADKLRWFATVQGHQIHRLCNTTGTIGRHGSRTAGKVLQKTWLWSIHSAEAKQISPWDQPELVTALVAPINFNCRDMCDRPLDLTNKLYVSDVLLPLFDVQKETLIYFSSLKVSPNLFIHFFGSLHIIDQPPASIWSPRNLDLNRLTR